MKLGNQSAMVYVFVLIHILATGWLFSTYGSSNLPNKYFNENIFTISGIFITYFIAKGIIVHKSLNCGDPILDFAIERLFIPIAMALLLNRHIGIVTNLLDDPRFWIIVVFFADPLNSVRGFFGNLNTIQSGKFLGPLIPNQPESSFDYISPVLLFMVFYFVMFR